jgi:hypothetical protein
VIAHLLRRILRDQITTAGPEFAEMARAARNFNSPELRESVKGLLAKPQKQYVADRLKHLLIPITDSNRASPRVYPAGKHATFVKTIAQ